MSDVEKDLNAAPATDSADATPSTEPAAPQKPKGPKKKTHVPGAPRSFTALVPQPDSGTHKIPQKLPDNIDFDRPLSAARSADAGRNDPCPCGSGKKFKKCCGK